MADKGARFLVRFRVDLFLPGGHAHRTAGGDAGVAVRFRPFLLGPIFKAQGWDTSPFNVYPAKGRHMWRDLERLCADLSLPFRRPSRFRRTACWPRASRWSGWPTAGPTTFCRAVFRAEFGEGRRIDDAQPSPTSSQTCSLDATRVLAAAQSDEIKLRLRQQTDEAQRLGIFGAPSFVTATANCSGATIGWSGRSLWAARGLLTLVRIEPHRQAGARHVLLGLAHACARRNGRSRPPAPRWRGRRGCPRPDDRECRRRPRRSPAPAPRRRWRG